MKTPKRHGFTCPRQLVFDIKGFFARVVIRRITLLRNILWVNRKPQHLNLAVNIERASVFPLIALTPEHWGACACVWILDSYCVAGAGVMKD